MIKHYICIIYMFSTHKNEDIMSLAGKWMELGNIILSEVIQTQREMHNMHSLVNRY